MSRVRGFLLLIGAVLVCHLAGPRPLAAQAFGAIDRAALDGIRRGIYPGAVVVIGRRDTILYARGFGRHTWSKSSPQVHPDSTIWDIASVSKVVGTASAAMRLADRGVLDLNAPVRRYLPKFRGGQKDRVTVRMLLDHTSGLHSYREFYKQAKTRERAIELLLAEPLRRPPGDSPVYSDLNALLLGLVIERVTGASLDVVVTREVLTPLGMTHSMYRPDKSLHSRIAPTSSWRGHPIGGVVNDQNAVVFGGAAGHAGLFSTGRDLARFAQAWLRGGADSAGKRWVSRAAMQRFLTRSPEAGARLLGWDTPDTTHVSPSAFGTTFSATVYGHTGWTGTQLWVDPSRDLFVVFLTNRSFDPKGRESLVNLRVVRAALADAALRLPPGPCSVQLATRC